MAAASREGHHRQRRVLVTGRREGVATKHVQVRDVMCLAERIQHSLGPALIRAVPTSWMDPPKLTGARQSGRAQGKIQEIAAGRRHAQILYTGNRMDSILYRSAAYDPRPPASL